MKWVILVIIKKKSNEISKVAVSELELELFKKNFNMNEIKFWFKTKEGVSPVTLFINNFFISTLVLKLME